MVAKTVPILLVLLGCSTSSHAQLGGLLGAVTGNLAGAVGGVANTVANAAASVVADTGFNLGWWDTGVFVPYNLAVANAQVSVQGCTPYIYDQIVSVRTDAYSGGYQPEFISGIGDIDVVGPGIFHCYNQDYTTAFALPARQWAIANGYVFGRRLLRS